MLSFENFSAESPSEKLETGQRESGSQDRKAMRKAIWNRYYEDVAKDEELLSLVGRGPLPSLARNPHALLESHGYPSRSTISELKFDRWKEETDQKFVKDGRVIVLRGDYPDRERAGFYAYTFAYLKHSVAQLETELESSADVNPLVYGEDWEKTTPVTDSIAEQLAYQQSAIGRSGFVSTTTNIPCAVSGTGNQPTAEEKATYRVYVLSIPEDCAIKRPDSLDSFGMEEEEYLVPDCIYPEEVIAVFNNDQPGEIYEYLHEMLGVTQEDVGYVPVPKKVVE